MKLSLVISIITLLNVVLWSWKQANSNIRYRHRHYTNILQILVFRKLLRWGWKKAKLGTHIRHIFTPQGKSHTPASLISYRGGQTEGHLLSKTVNRLLIRKHLGIAITILKKYLLVMKVLCLIICV